MYEVTGKDVANALGCHEKKGRAIFDNLLERCAAVHAINPEGFMIEFGLVVRERRRMIEFRHRMAKEREYSEKDQD